MHTPAPKRQAPNRLGLRWPSRRCRRAARWHQPRRADARLLSRRERQAELRPPPGTRIRGRRSRFTDSTSAHSNAVFVSTPPSALPRSSIRDAPSQPRIQSSPAAKAATTELHTEISKQRLNDSPSATGQPEPVPRRPCPLPRYLHTDLTQAGCNSPHIVEAGP